MPDFAGGTPWATDSVLKLDGERYHLRQDERGVIAWASQRVSDQEADAATQYAIPVRDFSRGSGFSFEGPEGTYDEADGWDLITPGKAVTWPLLATAQEFESTDARGWQFFVGGYLYVARGRYVCKYEPDDTPGSEWPIIEIHDLGDGMVIGGRPAIFQGAAYVPRRAGANGAGQRFHELTTVATHVVESQTITITGTPTGGHYTVTFDGKTTANIAFDANAATLQAALRLISGLELVTVSSSGSSPDFVHTVVMTGVAGAMGAASAPQMTSDDSNLTGGTSPAVAHATTVAGTTDTWTLGPANEESVAFIVWREKLVRAKDNQIALVSADPMTEGDWGPPYTVGDSGQPVTDLGLWDRLIVVGKTDGPWAFDVDLIPYNLLPDLQAVADDSNCLGMQAALGGLLIPHKTGLILWDGAAYRHVGPEFEGGLEGSLSGGWGRVQSIAPYGRYVFYVANNAFDTTGALLSLNPTGGRETQSLTPHMHHETEDASYEHVLVLSRSTVPASAHFPATAADDNAVGTVAWTDPSNATAEDDAYAVATSAGTTHYLKLTNFGFNVPESATVTGVKVAALRRAEPEEIELVAETTDGYIQSSHATYSTMRDGANLAGDTASGIYRVGQIWSEGAEVFVGYEAFLRFATSTIPDTAHLAYATLEITVLSMGVDDDYDILAAVYDWGAAVATDDWRTAAQLDALTPIASLATAGLAAGQTSAFEDEGTGLAAAIDPSADTPLILYSAKLADGIEPTQSEEVDPYSANTGTAANRPTLTLGYHEVVDATVKLVKGGAVVGDNKADTANDWPAANATKEYGGSTDLWGTTLNPSDVNASDFGMVISATVSSGDAYIDAVSITVYYSLPGAVDNPSYMSVLHVHSDRATAHPHIYALPRAGLMIANDPFVAKASSDARLRTSRYYRPSRNIPKTWVAYEFYAEFDPQVNTPGLEVWGIVENGTPVQLLDADGDAVTFSTNGHHRAFFPAGTTGRWCAIEYRVPATTGGEVDVAVTIREGRLIAALNPRERNRMLANLVLGPGEFPDLASMRRTVRAQRDALNTLVGQVVEYKNPLDESGYASVASVAYEETQMKVSQKWVTVAKVELHEALYS